MQQWKLESCSVRREDFYVTFYEAKIWQKVNLMLDHPREANLSRDSFLKLLKFHRYSSSGKRPQEPGYKPNPWPLLAKGQVLPGKKRVPETKLLIIIYVPSVTKGWEVIVSVEKQPLYLSYNKN